MVDSNSEQARSKNIKLAVDFFGIDLSNTYDRLAMAGVLNNLGITDPAPLLESVGAEVARQKAQRALIELINKAITGNVDYPVKLAQEFKEKYADLKPHVIKLDDGREIVFFRTHQENDDQANWTGDVIITPNGAVFIKSFTLEDGHINPAEFDPQSVLSAVDYINEHDNRQRDFIQTAISILPQHGEKTESVEGLKIQNQIELIVALEKTRLVSSGK